MKRALPILILLAGCSASESPILPDTNRESGGFVIDTEPYEGVSSPVTPRNEKPPVPQLDASPLRLEIARERHLVTIYTAEDVHGAGWCRPCMELKARWREGNDRIQIEWKREAVPGGPDVYPAIRWKDATGTVRYPTDDRRQYRVPQSLDELQSIIERNRAYGTRLDAKSVGAAAVLRGKRQVVAALEWIRQHVGEGVPITFAWDRTGAQTFPLLSDQDFSAIALLGTSGHLSLSAPGCRLPIDHVGFGYRVSGDDLILDADPVTLEGLASRLSPTSLGSLTSNQRVGFLDPLTIWSIFSVLKTVWALLHPQADLTLGGNVSATAILQGETLAIDFQQMPSIRLVMLFTFHLAVRRLELSPDQCRILFSGSRLVRERTILIRD